MFKARVFLDDFCCELYNGFSFWEFADCDFVRSGMIYVNTGSVRFLGIDGNSWSNVSARYVSIGNAVAYTFDLSPSETHPSHGPLGRWHGFPVRCLV